jgi:hypothetical protein
MTRFLCLSLLFAFVLPLFAQEEPALPGQLPPPDPAALMRLRERITFDLQELQRMIPLVRHDAQLTDSLTSRQAELTQQLREIMQQQFQPPGMPVQPAAPTPGIRTGQPPMPLTPQIPPELQGYMQIPQPAVPFVPENGFQNQRQFSMEPTTPTPMPNFNPPMPTHYPANNWGAIDQDAQWGPRLPRELTDVRLSVESMKKEISDLKETIKTLETQIQLLNRNILLLDRVKENGN